MSLESIPGQLRAKRFLNQLIRTGQVPHALLFSGMAGIGKADVGRELAKILNCLDPRGDDCCDACESCRKLSGDTHPDCIRITSQGVFIKIEQIRALKERLRFRPFEGKWRVVLIEEAHKLKEEAANALLKILEEPPKHNIFILLTLEPQMLLPTIVSRCCHIRFQPLDNALIEQYLITGHQMAPGQATEVARLAGGSLERARWWTEADRIARWKEVLRRTQGLRDLPMLDFFPQMDQWAKESEDLEQDMECIKLWIRDLILSRLMKSDYRLLDAAVHNSHTVPVVPVMNLFHLHDTVERAMQHLRQNANKQLTLEGVCLAIKDSLYGKGSWNPVPGGR